MRHLRNYLNEGLLNRKVSTKTPIRYKPTNRAELMNNILELLKKGITNLNCIDVSKVTDMHSLFSVVYTSVAEIDISEWDVSNVTNMNYMFDGCKHFNSDLSKWDVSNVTTMIHMFDDCETFNSDLSKWDVSKVKNMYDMFNGCVKFDSDLSHWNMSEVKDIQGMFDYCDTLKKNNKIPAWYEG